MQCANDGNAYELDCTRLRIPKCSTWEDFGALLEQKMNPTEVECVRFWVLSSKASLVPSSDEPVGDHQCLWGRVLTHRPSYSNEMRSRDRSGGQRVLEFINQRHIILAELVDKSGMMSLGPPFAIYVVAAKVIATPYTTLVVLAYNSP